MRHEAEQSSLPMEVDPRVNLNLEEQEEEEEGMCPGSRYGGRSPRDPAFNEYHDLDDGGKCRQCHQQIGTQQDEYM